MLMFERWKRRLRTLDQMEYKADDFIHLREVAVVANAWELWKQRVNLLEKEQHITLLVDSRIKGNTWKIWKSRM